jgi:Tfp pilus assembly protein PilX
MKGGTKTVRNRGFALLIAVVLSAVAAAITVSLTTLAYKSLLLSSAARESQYAFYAADSALECALYNDNGSHAAFPYSASPGNVSINCAGTNVTLAGSSYDSHTTEYQSAWFAINGTDCARITVYKGDSSTLGTQLYSDGANVTCGAITTDPRTVERGLEASY